MSTPANTPIGVLVVDDEPIARRRLLRMLAEIEGVHVVGEAADGEAARSRVTELNPDVVLLDIDMPECDGLTLAATASLPAIIFVTAHREHAVEAFELDAVDYLLKPVNARRLRAALQRWAARRAEVLPASAPPDPRRPPRLSARAQDTIHVFDARNIGRIGTRDKYAMFEVDGVEYLLDESLTELERRLAPWDFVRVHRAELVNLAHVTSVRVGAGESSVQLRDGTQVPVSRRLLAELKRRLR